MIKKMQVELPGDGKGGRATKRILKELTDFVSNPPNTRFKIYPSADDVFFWKALIIGPPKTTYNQGVY